MRKHIKETENSKQSHIGERYGRLTVTGIVWDEKRKRWAWECKCDCGKSKIILPSHLKRGLTRSCGCLHDEIVATKAIKYKHKTKDNKALYSILHGMMRRCNNENDARYKDYGGRGIKICDEWDNLKDGFDNFCDWSYSNGYEDGLTIERIDVNGDYCPANCKWITIKEQAQNTRKTKWVDYKGERIQLKKLCDRLGVTYDTVHNRIYTLGWNIEKAVETPSQRENSFQSKCREHGINCETVRDRINKLGWTEEEALNTPTFGRGSNSKTYGRHENEKATCKICGKEFVKNTGKQIYCSQECNKEAQRIKRKEGCHSDRK